MKKDLLMIYINKLTKEDIKNYISKECIEASIEEIDLIYKTIKTDYNTILNTDFMSYISKYENKLNRELYLKIIEKYNKYKAFLE